MAEDTIIAEESDINMHPCDTPRGMFYYELGLLTSDAQENLNQLKRDTIRKDEKYLAAHPEIRAIIAIILNHIFKERPRENVHEYVAEIFAKNKDELQKEINRYTSSREPHIYEAISAMELFPSKSKSTSEEEEEEEEEMIEEEELKYIQLPSNVLIPQDIVRDIVDKVIQMMDFSEVEDEGELFELVASNILSQSISKVMLRSATGLTDEKAIAHRLESKLLNNVEKINKKIIEKIKERKSIELSLDLRSSIGSEEDEEDATETVMRTLDEIIDNVISQGENDDFFEYPNELSNKIEYIRKNLGDGYDGDEGSLADEQFAVVVDDETAEEEKVVEKNEDKEKITSVGEVEGEEE